MAAKHGLKGIELFYEDLVDHAHGSTTASDLITAASSINNLCISLNLEIICLQPFMHYEGLIDRRRHNERIEEVKLWMKLAHVLGTDIIQVPSSFLSQNEVSSDVDLMVADLRQLADLGLQESPVIRFAYESLSWGTYVDKWEACWDIVQRVDRPNFGICLDSFNILGRIYADPTAESGRLPHAEQEVRESMRRLVDRIGPYKEKIFFIQIVDAERLGAPLIAGHPFYNATQPARMSWSRNCRLFYGETEHGAYLPVKDVAQAILNEIGYEGWVSMELFNRVMDNKNPGVVQELAFRAARSWDRLVSDLQLAPKTIEGPSKSDGAQLKRGSGIAYSTADIELARL